MRATLWLLAVLAHGGLFLESQPGRSRPAAHEIVKRAVSYVEAYEPRLGALVAEEVYVQRLARGFGPSEQRRLKSDLLLVRPEGADTWLPFRDVIEVNGARVRDRDERLQRLFLDPSPAARRDLRRLMDESARYNLGSFHRNINTPPLALAFLRQADVSRFDFEVRQPQVIEGDTAWEVAYAERVRPTIVRGGPTGDEDLPITGRFWIREADGAVLRTRLSASPGGGSATITVYYCQEPRVDELVPCRMEEHYRSGGETLYATATYRNVRRFAVTTEEEIR